MGFDFSLLSSRTCLICSERAGSEILCAACQHLTEHIGSHCPTCAASVSDPSYLCGACLVDPKPYDALYAAFRYRAVVRDVILQVKYKRSRAAISLTQSWMLMLCTLLPTDLDLIVPVPISMLRLLQRGFNQTHYLTAVISKERNVICAKGALLKASRPPQSKQKNDNARLRNIQGVFKPGFNRVYGHVLLVDDVFTSGATVTEAARVLKSIGADRVSVVVLAAR